jgi:hypothetical protein
MSVVCAVNGGTSKCPSVMLLIRHLFFIAAKYAFDLRLKFIAGRDNVSADVLSCLHVKDFLAGNLSADVNGTVVPKL